MNKISDIADTVVATFNDMVIDTFLQNYVSSQCGDVWGDAYTHFNNTNVVSYVKKWAKMTNDRLDKYQTLIGSGATKTSETNVQNTYGDTNTRNYIYPEGYIGDSNPQQLRTENDGIFEDDISHTIINEKDNIAKLNLSFEEYMNVCLMPDKMISGLIALV